MFLIAGVQPKTRRVDEHPQRCPACGLARAYTTRVDHYLSLFFIPLFRVKRGEPFLLCNGCQRPVDGFQASSPDPPQPPWPSRSSSSSDPPPPWPSLSSPAPSMSVSLPLPPSARSGATLR